MGANSIGRRHLYTLQPFKAGGWWGWGGGGGGGGGGGEIQMFCFCFFYAFAPVFFILNSAVFAN